MSELENARTVQLVADGPQIPLELLRSRSKGDVIFIAGAGASKSRGLPLFRDLTHDVYKRLTGSGADVSTTPAPERDAFCTSQYDVALGLLEARIDGKPHYRHGIKRNVREAVTDLLKADSATAGDVHKHLLQLARDQQGRPRLVTTNFDTLFERAWPEVCATDVLLLSSAGAAMPGPGTFNFAGVLHIHGRLRDDTTVPPLDSTDLVLTAADFGDAYLRSGWAARFLYDLVRRYQVVLVGYGAEDPPLKYMLNVISADRTRFPDLRQIYAFAGYEPGKETADNVAQTWLAKDIRPIVYSSVNHHQLLYETLKEWAAWADDPSSWADTRFGEISSTPYNQSRAHDRGVMELLLASSANSKRFKERGGDFSWIRAIERERPDDHRAADARGTVSPAASYLDNLRMWLLGKLSTPEATTWVVERLAPKRRLPRIAAANNATDEPSEVSQMTELQGHRLSVSETALLQDIVDRESGTWKIATQKFWFVVLHVLTDKQNVNRDDAFHLLERIKSAQEPQLIDAQRLAMFLRPRLKIDRRSAFDIRPEPQSANALDRVSIAVHWEGYPAYREVVAGLPNDVRWLESFLRAAELELAALYQLSTQLGWSDEVDQLSIDVQRLWYTEGGVGSGEDEDPDGFRANHVALVRVVAAAWRKLAAADTIAARRIANGWRLRSERLFQRLFFHCLSASSVLTNEEACQALKELNDADLWFQQMPEAGVAIAKRWRDMPEDCRSDIESRLRSGPPPSLWEDGLDEDKERWRQMDVKRFFAAITIAGGFLSEASQAVADQLHVTEQIPAGATVESILEDRSQPLERRPADLTQFSGLHGEQLLNKATAQAAARQFLDGDSVAALIHADLERVLHALLESGADKHADLWRRVLWRLREGKASDNTAEFKRATLHALTTMPAATLQVAGQAAASWLERITVGDDQDQAQTQFIQDNQKLVLDAWSHLATYLFQQGSDESAVTKADEGERLMSRALNTGAGVIGFVALALFDRARRAPDAFTVLAAARDQVDATLVALTGVAGQLVSARLAEWMELASLIFPQATTALVIIPLTRESPDLTLLDLQVLYGRRLTASQYQRLEPAYLREATATRLSRKGRRRLIQRLTMQLLERFDGKTSPAPEPAVMRSVLRQTTEEARIAAADTVARWFQDNQDRDVIARWKGVGDNFFETVWPLDAVLRTSESSKALARIPTYTQAAFPLAVAKVVPLIVPFELWRVDTLFTSLPSDNGGHGAFVAQHWDASLSLADAALGVEPQIVPHDLSEWLSALQQARPAVTEDQRFRRLSKLVDP